MMVDNPQSVTDVKEAPVAVEMAPLEKRLEEIYHQQVEAVTQNANHVWEFDLDHDLLLSERGQNGDLFDRGDTQSYTGILAIVAKAVPEGYRQRVEYVFGRDHLLREFSKAQQQIQLDYPINLINTDGLTWVQGTANTMLASDGTIRAIICMRDITNRDKVKEMIDHANECDPLSGLLNGEVFRQRVTDVLKNDRRTKEGYLFIIDIDNFEEINKEQGKAYGDEVIRSLAEVLKGCFRSEDILGRVGGDEFMAFVSNIDAERAKERASEIAEDLGQTQHAKMVDLAVTLSIGIAEAGIYDGYASLHKKAYKALYRAKSNGKGSWSLWE